MRNSIWYMYAETLALAGGLASLSKHTIRRNRPYVYNSDASKDEKHSFSAHHSFFSGHEANSSAVCFLTASLVNYYTKRQELKWAAWAGALVISCAMGYMRYASGKHYLSDVLTGYIIGAGTGIWVPLIHKNQLS